MAEHNDEADNKRRVVAALGRLVHDALEHAEYEQRGHQHLTCSVSSFIFVIKNKCFLDQNVLESGFILRKAKYTAHLIHDAFEHPEHEERGHQHLTCSVSSFVFVIKNSVFTGSKNSK